MAFDTQSAGQPGREVGAVDAIAVAALFSAVRLTESNGPATRLDLPGVALVSAGSMGVVRGLVCGNEAG